MKEKASCELQLESFCLVQCLGSLYHKTKTFQTKKELVSILEQHWSSPKEAIEHLCAGLPLCSAGFVVTEEEYCWVALVTVKFLFMPDQFRICPLKRCKAALYLLQYVQRVFKCFDSSSTGRISVIIQNAKE